VPRVLYEASQLQGQYRFDPEKDILFFYTPDDTAAELRLRELFPTGYWQFIKSYKPGKDFKVFRVPRLGTEAFVDFVIQSGVAE
jgi:hypothetical protein